MITLDGRAGKRIGAGIAALAVTGLFIPSSAVADQDSDVEVINTETVQVYTDANGKVESKRLYEQLTLSGSGRVSLDNPVETSGLRNIDGFSGVDVSKGKQHVEKNIDGVEHMRTVSDFKGKLPLDVKVEYKLNGKVVSAEKVVGKDGTLEVAYTVQNSTAKKQEISYPDGQGGQIVELVDVPIPMVGSMTTTLPASFTEVKSGEANMAGDGRGGTKMSFTMTLVPPIGSDTATFGYSAQIKDGVIPRASLSALPVNPLESPTFQSAASSYQGGAETGTKLVAGATEIDSNLLRLRDGASDLLAGLVQLSDGATQLRTGLNDSAVPGAEKLAGGADELVGGLVKLDKGAADLSQGSKDLAAGTGKAKTGSQKLYDGLTQLSGGLDQLSAKDGLPAAEEGITKLQAGVDALLVGFGAPGKKGTVLYGLTELEKGSQELAAGLEQLKGDGTTDNPGLVAAKGGVDQVNQGLAESVKQGGSVDQLLGGLNLLKANPDCLATCDAFIDAALIPGVQKSKESLTKANEGLTLVSAGLEGAVVGLTDKLIPGVKTLTEGLTETKAGATKLQVGLTTVDGGLVELATGLTDAVVGVLRLSDGASSAKVGSGDLKQGLVQLDDGTKQLSSGADQLSDGTSAASEGGSQVADGADQLVSGLGDAASGSDQLADGLARAKASAPRLPEGAERLSNEGMSKLITAGKLTAMEYGKLYAVVDAGSMRAQQASMAKGAPEGARGLTAYSFELQGEDGEGERNVQRALGAAILLGLGLGVFALRRRFII